jgi:hypothetical protein
VGGGVATGFELEVEGYWLGDDEKVDAEESGGGELEDLDACVDEP